MAEAQVYKGGTRALNYARGIPRCTAPPTGGGLSPSPAPFQCAR
jgi:hypothetical protein